MLLHMLNKRPKIIHLFGKQILIDYKHFLFVNNFIIRELIVAEEELLLRNV
jgi:hypothetical protein